MKELDGKVMSGMAKVLTSVSADDENTLDEPAKVVPVTEPVEAAADFCIAFSAHAVTIIQLKIKNQAA